MPEEFLRLLLGGVGWGFGLMLARQGDRPLAMFVTHSLTHSVTFSKLDSCDPGV